MSEPKPAEATNRLGLFLLWWESWVGRFAIQLPWVLCAVAYVGVLNSAQGQTALEFPVERPLTAIFVVAVLVGACVFVAQQLSTAYRIAGLTPRIMTLRVGLKKPWVRIDPSRLAHEGSFVLFASIVVLSGVFASGVMTVASVSGAAGWGFSPIFMAGLLVGYFAVFSVAGLSLVFWESSGLLVAASALVLALALYAVGIYLVTYRLDELVSVGPHAIAASGLLLVTLLCQGLICFLLMQFTLRAVWLVIALVAFLYWMQEPLAERPNPLLAATPNVARANGECARLSGATPVASPVPSHPQPQTGAPPPILISAEGGGIRAAFWTAVSLEELSEARSVPLLTDTDILSGVSGGSLGIATFLAAQDLPPEARLACIREFLSGDFVSPLLAGLFFLDVPRLVIPTWLLDKHRGDYFEEFIARRWLALTGSEYFYRTLKQAAGDGRRAPAVYFNATDALSGQYIALTAHQADSEPASDQSARSRLNAAVLGQLPGLRIAQAVSMSARFPYMSPSPDLRAPAQDVSRALFGQADAAKGTTTRASLASLVDGGYFDNSGLWPALRLLERDRARNPTPQRFVLHIINDQFRSCSEATPNTGCIDAQAALLKGRRSSHGGWLARPTDAIVAVQTQHSLQSLTALDLAQSQLKNKVAQWKNPMPPVREAPWLVAMLLKLPQWLPVHGRDLRFGEVALEWTLAPAEREFLCIQAAVIRTTEVPGIQSVAAVDRTRECSSRQN
jgi:predicted acylesterase/phospholipase RssA